MLADRSARRITRSLETVVLVSSVFAGSFEVVLETAAGRHEAGALRGRRYYQSGGDFLVDRSGNILFAHRSQDPADRPAAAKLLEAIDRLLGKT